MRINSPLCSENRTQSLLRVGGFSPFTITKSCACQCIGKWQKSVSQNSYLTILGLVWLGLVCFLFYFIFYLFFNHHLSNLSSTLTKWKLAAWEKVNFLGRWEGGWGTVYIGKRKSKVHVEIPHYTYFLLTLNYFCIYTWGDSLCLDLKCTSGGIFKNPSKYQFFPTSTIVLVPSVAFDFIFLTLFPITTAAINTRFFFWLFDITLIAMHILCLFKNKAGEYVFEEENF